MNDERQQEAQETPVRATAHQTGQRFGRVFFGGIARGVTTLVGGVTGVVRGGAEGVGAEAARVAEPVVHAVRPHVTRRLKDLRGAAADFTRDLDAPRGRRGSRSGPTGD